MAVSPMPPRKPAATSPPAAERASFRICALPLSSSSSASAFAGRIDSATSTPAASGTMATKSGSEPLTPTPPSTNGPMNWQVA